MATKLKTIPKLINIGRLRNFSSGNVASGGNVTPQAPAPASGIPDNVPGLSTAVVSYDKTPVGPGAAKNSGYKNPEYFCYHRNSYFEAEIEMAKYRCPQPSSKKK